MTPGLTDTITRDRFKSWARVLKEHSATPALVMCVGHGAHQGEIHLVCVEDLAPAEVIAFLRHAIAEIESAEGGGL